MAIDSYGKADSAQSEARPANEHTLDTTPKIVKIPLSALEISKLNVRKDVCDVSDLAASMLEKGVLQPLLVRREGDRYGVIIGSRRLVAARQANLQHLPVIIYELNDSDAQALSLIENIHRHDLKPVEVSRTLSLLLETYHSRELAKIIGKSHTYVLEMACAIKLLSTLEERGIKVEFQPSKEKRDNGQAIPIQHAIYVAEVAKRRPMEFGQDIDKQIIFCQKLTTVNQQEARNITKYAIENPNLELAQIVKEGKYGTSSKSTAVTNRSDITKISDTTTKIPTAPKGILELIDENVQANKPKYEDLTKTQQEEVDLVKYEYETNKQLYDLIYKITGKTLADQGRILQNTSKGLSWHDKLADESYEFMLTSTKKLSDGQLSPKLHCVRTLISILNKYADVLYLENETRKRTRKLAQE